MWAGQTRKARSNRTPPTPSKTRSVSRNVALRVVKLARSSWNLIKLVKVTTCVAVMVNSKTFCFLSFSQVASGMILVMAFFLITYTFHSTWVTSEAYSSPSIVLSARGGDGSRIIFDDFREAYYWLRHNTPEVSPSEICWRQNKKTILQIITQEVLFFIS